MPRTVRTTALIGGLLAMTSPAFAWKGPEHREIGDRGFAAALAELGKAQRRQLLSRPHLHGRHKTVGAVAGGQEFARFTFGQLVALYGDHISSVQELNSAGFGRFGRSARERATILKRISAGKVPIASFPGEHKHKVDLAINNPDHFSRRAVLAYIMRHREAVIMASRPGHLWLALHVEARALHSFTDLFAFGHMIDNRERSDRLVDGAKEIERKFAPLGKLAGQLAKASAAAMGVKVNWLHNALNFKGSHLTNLRGESWRGYGDGRYRIPARGCGRKRCADPGTRQQRAIIVRAVSVSIGEVLHAALGQSARSTMAATCFLPVRYAGAYWPVDAGKQMHRLAKLAHQMQQQGRPLHKTGFDFSQGILKYEKRQRAGTVDYIDLVEKHCRRGGR